jgi:putative transposase
LSKLVSVHGAPLFMRSDNGPEFVSHAILEWIAQSGIATAMSDSESLGRTVLMRASMASSAMNACRLNGSGHAAKRPSSSRLGGVIATPSGRTAA